MLLFLSMLQDSFIPCVIFFSWEITGHDIKNKYVFWKFVFFFFAEKMKYVCIHTKKNPPRLILYNPFLLR